jgi:hypothetical protein
LPTGTAYSVRHASTVQFPYARRPLLAAPGQAQPHNRNGGIPVQTTVYQPEPAPQPGIPVFDTANRTAYTPAQLAHIRARYERLGSIKAVERELYDQDGGYWFYRLQEVLS